MRRGRQAGPRQAVTIVAAGLVLALLASAPVLARDPDVNPAAPATSPADIAPLTARPAIDAPATKGGRLEARVARVARLASEGKAAEALEAVRSMALPRDEGRMRLVVESDAPAVARRSAAALGLDVERSAGTLVQVMATPAQAARLGRARGVDRVRPPFAHEALAVAGQGVGLTEVTAWHAAGITGAGVKVAVVDLGFAGLAAAQSSGDLPATLTTVDYCGGALATGTEHGTGVAEIVHEMAPDAQLHLICVETEVDLAQAVTYAQANGIRVINHSVGWFNTSRGDGTGEAGTPEAIALAARDAGILWVNAAGNHAQLHWSGTFADDGDGYHLFAPGTVGNGLYVDGGDYACAVLKWDDWPASDQDFDLYLVNAAGDLLTSSENPQTGSEMPTEEACWENGGGATAIYVVISAYDTTATPRFDLFALNSPGMEFTVAAGSIVEPAGAPSVVAVGAACWGSSTVEPYSSRGPAIDGRTKPDLAGPDQVSGTTYGAFAGCGSYYGFPGTSAAAPHVAGAAALELQRRPAATPAQLASFLVANARDLGVTGPDNAAGSGMLDLPAPNDVAVALVSSPTPSDVDAEVTLTATIAPGEATGTVSFRDISGGAPVELGSSAVSGGLASLTTTFASAGSRLIDAMYSGDGTFPPGTSQAIVHSVRAADLVSTTVTVTLASNPVAIGQAATFTATVAPNAGAGVVTWLIDGAPAGVTPLAADGTASLGRTYWSTGVHAVVARFDEGSTHDSSTSAPTTLTVLKAMSVTLSSSRTSAVAGETLVTFAASVPEPGATGAVAFLDSFDGTTRTLATVAATLDANGEWVARLATRLTGIGVHTITARYAGNATYASAMSNAVALPVGPDVGVGLSGVGVSFATFYPYKDGYRDTVAIRGTPLEPVVVSIKVYNGAGRIVRSWSLPLRTAKWSIAWSGRTASGTRLAAGRYRVVQRATDRAGHAKAVTSYATISNKRLYWSSTSITRYADAGRFSYGGDGAGVYHRASDRHVLVDGGYCDGACGVAMGIHRFTLRSAVQYRSLSFSVLGRSWSSGGPGRMAVMDATGQFDVSRTVGTSWAWRTTSTVGAPTHVDSSDRVSGVVWALGSNESAVEYLKVRINYSYAVLR